MLSTTAAAIMSTDQRLDEIAAVLAAGVLRLHSRSPAEGAGSVTEPTCPILSESAAQGLDVPSETVLSVLHGG